MTRAGIYGRNSKANEKSIDDQLKLGRAAVGREGWTLAGEYHDDSSASRYRTKERDDWARLLADLAAGALDVLVLWKPARGSRDAIEWLQMLEGCRSRGTRIHVMAHRRTYDLSLPSDWETLAVEGIKSASYSDQLSEDVTRGVREAAIVGAPHGRVAFGHDAVYDPVTGRPGRVPNAHAPIVREIIERLDKLTPISALEREFRERGLPSPSGKPWRRNTIRILATNLAYIGIRRHEGEDHRAQWPAIVDEEMFWRVQALLNQPERKTTRPGSAKYLLSYIATAPCGAHIQRVSGKPGALDRYACTQNGCVSIVRGEVDEIVEEVILGRLALPDARAVFTEDDTKTKAAKAEASRYRAQLEEARVSYESPDGISADALARKERSLLPLIKEADARARPVGTAGVLEELLSAEELRAAWQGLEMAARRSVVALLVQVRIGPPAQRGRRTADPVERLAQTFARLGASTWARDSTPWASSQFTLELL
jgi:site-specific DNA recombinase